MMRVHWWLPRITFLAVWMAATALLLIRQEGWSLHGQNPISWEVLNGSFDQANAAGQFHGKKLLAAAVDETVPEEVPVAVPSSRRIEVDLTHQRLYAFDGDQKVYDFLISSGKWGRTPTGTFRIWGKFRYTKMSGGSKALNTYYYLPNVPFVMFFSNDEIAASRGFSLHGTYWHENFGHPMSHGCINMKTEEAEQIYHWVGPVVSSGNSQRANEENPGTEVIIYGVAPKE